MVHAHVSSYEPPLPCGAAPHHSAESNLVDELQAALLAGKDTSFLRQQLASVRALRAAAIAKARALEQATCQAIADAFDAAGAVRAAGSRDDLARQLAALQPIPFPPTAG